MTLNMLATETRWQRKRPLRILFTMIAPKEPPPSLEKEPMPILEIPPAEVSIRFRLNHFRLFFAKGDFSFLA